MEPQMWPWLCYSVTVKSWKFQLDIIPCIKRIFCMNLFSSSKSFMQHILYIFIHLFTQYILQTHRDMSCAFISFFFLKIKNINDIVKWKGKKQSVELKKNIYSSFLFLFISYLVLVTNIYRCSPLRSCLEFR